MAFVRVARDGVPVTQAKDVALDASLGKRFTLKTDVVCLLYTSPSPRDRTRSRMPSSA